MTLLTDIIGTDKLLIVMVRFVTVTTVMTIRAALVHGGVFTGMRLTHPHFTLYLTIPTAAMFALVLRRCKHLSIKVSSSVVFTTLGFTDRATWSGNFPGGATTWGWTGLGATGHCSCLCKRTTTMLINNDNIVHFLVQFYRQFCQFRTLKLLSNNSYRILWKSIRALIICLLRLFS